MRSKQQNSGVLRGFYWVLVIHMNKPTLDI